MGGRIVVSRCCQVAIGDRIFARDVLHVLPPLLAVMPGYQGTQRGRGQTVHQAKCALYCSLIPRRKDKHRVGSFGHCPNLIALLPWHRGKQWGGTSSLAATLMVALAVAP